MIRNPSHMSILIVIVRRRRAPVRDDSGFSSHPRWILVIGPTVSVSLAINEPASSSHYLLRLNSLPQRLEWQPTRIRCRHAKARQNINNKPSIIQVGYIFFCCVCVCVCISFTNNAPAGGLFLLYG